MKVALSSQLCDASRLLMEITDSPLRTVLVFFKWVRVASLVAEPEDTQLGGLINLIRRPCQFGYALTNFLNKLETQNKKTPQDSARHGCIPNLQPCTLNPTPSTLIPHP